MSNQESAGANKSKSAPNATSGNVTPNINLQTPSRKVGDNGNTNSCLSGPSNPKTVRRTKEGKIQVVHFDERVVVHTVPHWDPSRTQSFSDVSNPTDQSTCNCCVVV
mmetsp:Transcript_69799/g.110954  ORF Transcript_69799/g.110954 Transcript_69799/m.110954 type:complete len:107 (-) Transcript_69799:3349-3669(-)